MGSLWEVSASPLTIQWGKLGAFFLQGSSWRVFGLTALYKEHFPRKVLSLPQQAMLSQRRGLSPFALTLMLLSCWELNGKCWGRRRGLWLPCGYSTPLHGVRAGSNPSSSECIYFVYFFFHAKGKKSRQKGCNSRSVPPERVTGEMMMYEVASTHLAAHHLQTGARLTPS